MIVTLAVELFVTLAGMPCFTLAITSHISQSIMYDPLG